MGRLVAILVLVLVVWWLVRKLVRDRKSDTPSPAPAAQNEDMVACARCGVNMPRSEAREEAGKFYCVGNPQCLPRP